MNDPNTLLPTFNPITDLPEHFLMLVYGLRRSGKTVLMKYLMEQMQERLKYTEVYVICATLDVNPEQYDFVPKSSQFSDVENLDYRLRTIVDNQKQKMKEYRESQGGKVEFKKAFKGSDDDGSGS